MTKTKKKVIDKDLKHILKVEDNFVKSLIGAGKNMPPTLEGNVARMWIPAFIAQSYFFTTLLLKKSNLK